MCFVSESIRSSLGQEVVFGDMRFVTVVEKPPWSLDSVHTY